MSRSVSLCIGSWPHFAYRSIVHTCRQCGSPKEELTLNLHSVSAPRSSPCDACARLRAPSPHTHTLAPVSVGAPRSKAKHVLVRQRLSPEARCQVAASCRQLQGRTGACRAPLRAVSRSVGASLCVVMLRKGGARERTRERWFVGGHGELKHFPQFLDSDGVNLLSLGSPRAPCAYGIALRHFFAAAVEAKSDGPCFSDCMLRRVSAPDQRSQYLGVCCPYSWIYFMGWE